MQRHSFFINGLCNRTVLLPDRVVFPSRPCFFPNQTKVETSAELAMVQSSLTGPLSAGSTQHDPSWGTTLSQQIAQAAQLLRQARSPLLVVDAIDLAGAAEIVALARRLQARLDHAHTSCLGPLQEQGVHLTSHGEAGLRADHLLIIGDISSALGDDEGLARLLQPRDGRAFSYIGRGSPNPDAISPATYETPPEAIHAMLGAMVASAAGRKIDPSSPIASCAAELVSRMEEARYGVAVFAVGLIDETSQYALMSLINTLALKTRWTMLPIAVPAGQSELTRMTQALTGLPPPMAFRTCRATHDAYLHSARNVASRGECDVAVWLSSSRNPQPDWLKSVPQLVTITGQADPPAGSSAHIEIGIAGVDHAGIVEPSELGSFVAIEPLTETARPSAASVIAALCAELAPLAEENHA